MAARDRLRVIFLMQQESAHRLQRVKVEDARFVSIACDLLDCL